METWRGELQPVPSGGGSRKAGSKAHGRDHAPGRAASAHGGGAGRGGEGPLGPWPWIRVAVCDAWESAMGTEAVWVTVADESSWDVLRAVTPDEKAVIRAFAS